jgi:hypothetical protein
VDARAGVVDEDVDAAEPVEGCVEDSGHVMGNRDVGDGERNGRAAVGQGLGDRATAAGVTADQHHGGAGIGERGREAFSESTGAAGDDSDSTLEAKPVDGRHVTLPV